MNRQGCVIHIIGDFDALTSDAVKPLIKEAAKEFGTVVFDLSQLEFVDSSGLGAVVYAYKQVGAGKVKLINVPPMAMRVVRLTNLDKLMDVD